MFRRICEVPDPPSLYKWHGVVERKRALYSGKQVFEEVKEDHSLSASHNRRLPGPMKNVTLRNYLGVSIIQIDRENENLNHHISASESPCGSTHFR